MMIKKGKLLKSQPSKAFNRAINLENYVDYQVADQIRYIPVFSSLLFILIVAEYLTTYIYELVT